MMDAGRGFHQRTVEELARSETGMGRGPGRGREPGPPGRPRMWLGAAGLLGFLLVSLLLVLVLDCAGPGDPVEVSPSPPAVTLVTSRSSMEG